VVTFLSVPGTVLANRCIGNGNLGNNTAALCPTTPGMGDNVFSEGPVTLGGITITNLFAEISVAPGAGNSQVVAVLDNGVPTALTCAVIGTATTCTSAASVAVAAGHYLQVRINAGTGTFTARSWRVTFRN
jgi:hypothetical protein